MKIKKFLVLLLVFVMVTLPVGFMRASAQNPEAFASGYYHFDAETGYLTGVALGTTRQQLLGRCFPGDLQMSTDTVATGTQLMSADTVLATVVVSGDVNADGKLNAADLMLVKDAVLGAPLAEMQTLAADVSGDGDITVTDFLQFRSHILGHSRIEPPVRSDRTPMLLMTPGQSLQWQAQGSSYHTDTQAIVQVDETGMLRAQAVGTAWVSALDEAGNVVHKQLITVEAEPLQIRLEQDTVRLTKSKSQTLVAKLNHPVDAPITWESSDSEIVTVENGVISGVGCGNATVTATLENGSSAQAAITVAPAITSLKIERKLYKVKPDHTKNLAVVMDPVDGDEEILWTTSDPAIATIDDYGVATGHKNGTVTVTATGKYSGLSATCKLKVCNVKQVAFTFDDGPSTNTTKLLNFLKENDIRVTFFMVGNRMKSYESIVKREVAEGHEIAYHSYAHKNQTGLSDATIKADFEKSQKILTEMTGAKFTLWRTPGGNYNTRVLNCIELPHIMWSVDSLDWKYRNTSHVYNAVRKSPDGAIVLMHDLYATTASGAIMAMEEMLAGDYEFLTVTELLSRDGTPPNPHVSYNKA